jgi:hypothetical protein
MEAERGVGTNMSIKTGRPRLQYIRRGRTLGETVHTGAERVYRVQNNFSRVARKKSTTAVECLLRVRRQDVVFFLYEKRQQKQFVLDGGQETEQSPDP